MRVDQTFPRCARCGKMIHLRARRIELASGRRKLSFCSDRCHEEYLELHGLTVRGEWQEPSDRRLGAAA